MPAYRFLRRQVTWSGIPISKNFPQFVVIYTVKDFSVVNEAEIDVFLQFSYFFYDAMDVGNVGISSAFSKSSFYIWKFSVHIQLQLHLKNFPQFSVTHTVKSFNVVNEAEIDVFLQLSCFFYSPTDVGNLICSFSVFSNPA